MKKIYDIIIIGAGAAGMTAGIYGVRAGKKVLVFEKKVYGGQIINTTKIENYPAAPHITGVEFSKKLRAQAEELGVEFRLEEVEECSEIEECSGFEGAGAKIELRASDFLQGPKKPIFRVLTDEGEYFSRTVIFANGSTERKLGLPREEEFISRGISYCATCDGSLFRGKTVAINGGGNTALWSALYLSSLAEKVYLIHRREEFRADKALVEKVKALGNVEFIMNARIAELNGEEKLEKIKLEVKGEETAEKELEVEGLFVAIGRVPENEKFKEFIRLDKEGYIEANKNLETSRVGVFVAGDTRKKKLNQLVTATADGAIAATRAVEFLN